MKKILILGMSFLMGGLLVANEEQENVRLDVTLAADGEVISQPQLIVPSTGQMGVIELRTDERGVYLEIGANLDKDQALLHVRVGSMTENTRTVGTDSEIAVPIGETAHLKIFDEVGCQLELSIIPSLVQSELE